MHIKPSFIDQCRALAQGDLGCQAQVSQALEAAERPDLAGTYTQLYARPARAAAALADAGVAPSALAGLPVSIKDLFDVAGEVTLAGSTLRRDAPPARQDAPAVRRLRQAGAAVLGKTGMSEFAFSGVGINPHFGTPRNPHDPQVHRIPGGSSSGAAVSVAAGGCVAGLGSDTAGSLRIPAALCGLVGFKGTQSRVSREGAFPLSHQLDTVGAITRCVADAVTVDAVLADQALRLPQAPRSLRGRRLLVPTTLMLDQLDAGVSAAWDRAVAVLEDAGAEVVRQPLPQLSEMAQINAPGGLSPIEAWATHAADMRQRREAFDPRVAARIALGEAVTAEQFLTILARRRDWIARTTAAVAGYDALLAPTVPIVAPPVAELLVSDEAFFRVNGLLLRNTFAANFLDGCAISLPMHQAGELPTGLMLALPAQGDQALVELAWSVESALYAAGLGR